AACTLSLHDALPISRGRRGAVPVRARRQRRRVRRSDEAAASFATTPRRAGLASRPRAGPGRGVRRVLRGLWAPGLRGAGTQPAHRAGGAPARAGPPEREESLGPGIPGAGPALIARPRGQSTTPPHEIGDHMDTTADLLVIGAGMAGLTAAARATSRGARVTDLEKGDAIGGSAQFAGYAWTAPTREMMAEINPHGDEALRNAVVDDFAAGLDWIRGRGVDCADGVPVLRYGIGHAFDTVQYLDACAREVRQGGGQVLTGVEVTGLITEGDAVVGAVVRLGDGITPRMEAPRVLLATGGFQADAALVEEHLHPNASRPPLRSNQHSDGGGLTLAQSVGAAVGPVDAGFYGHLIPSGLSFRDDGDFVGL